MENEDLLFWLSWCIEEYAAEKQISSPNIALLFEQSDVLTYLSDNAEILHTQGKNYIISSIDTYLQNKTPLI